MYTGAAGMITQQHTMDTISNNLANVNTTSYKEDVSVHKAFPELLLRRLNTEITSLPISQTAPYLGSVDRAPVIGKLGTGVAQNEVFTVFSQGSMQETGNSFDLALEGEGFFVLDTPLGRRLTRNGSFLIGPEGLLVNKEGYPVLGENGPIAVKANNFIVDQNGQVFQNDVYANDPRRLVSALENQWEETSLVDTLLVTEVDEPRYLQKQGSSLYKDTWESGEIRIIEEGRPQIRQGFLETSNVNPITQMVKMIEVNRAYEASQKIIQSQDDASAKLINQAMRF